MKIIDAELIHGGILSEMHHKCFSDILKQWTPSIMQNLLLSPNNHGLIALDGEESPVGFLLYTLIGQMEGEIITIGSLKARQGIATRLLHHMLDEAHNQGVTEFFLEVSSRNGIGINLYEKLGFNQVGLRKNYYTNKKQKEDALIMRLQL